MMLISRTLDFYISSLEPNLRSLYTVTFSVTNVMQSEDLPSSPNPFSRRRRGAKPSYFLVPLSCGRGARGEGFSNFCVR